MRNARLFTRLAGCALFCALFIAAAATPRVARHARAARRVNACAFCHRRAASCARAPCRACAPHARQHISLRAGDARASRARRDAPPRRALPPARARTFVVSPFVVRARAFLPDGGRLSRRNTVCLCSSNSPTRHYRRRYFVVFARLSHPLASSRIWHACLATHFARSYNASHWDRAIINAVALVSFSRYGFLTTSFARLYRSISARNAVVAAWPAIPTRAASSAAPLLRVRSAYRALLRLLLFTAFVTPRGFSLLLRSGAQPLSINANASFAARAHTAIRVSFRYDDALSFATGGSITALTVVRTGVRWTARGNALLILRVSAFSRAFHFDNTRTIMRGLFSRGSAVPRFARRALHFAYRARRAR